MGKSVVCILILLIGSTAWAGFTPIGVTIDVTADGESAQYQWQVPDPGAAHAMFALPAEEQICGQSGNVLATIDLLQVELDDDPFVSLVFAVTAGPSDAIFTITSAAVGFPAITTPKAYATATATLTDQMNNGAVMTGLLANGDMYEARYNAGIVWADLVPSLSAMAGMSAVGQERRPAAPTMWEAIGVPVTDIQAEYKFQLSAMDSASGTSRFEVIPEPTTLSLLAVAVVMVRRRRS